LTYIRFVKAVTETVYARTGRSVACIQKPEGEGSILNLDVNAD